MGFKAQGSGDRVGVSRLQECVQYSGFEVKGSSVGGGDLGLEFRVKGLGFRVKPAVAHSRFRV